MLKNRLKILILILSFFISFICLPNELDGFTKDDRILILAPHPDDETIALGGLIQRAIKAGSKIRVILYTNGDNNELAFIVYKKRLVLKKKEFIQLGETRRKETIKAMEFLGLDSSNIISLGYPDFGTMEILSKYWLTEKPYKSMFARLTHVSYRDALSFGAPYVGESILNDLKNILLDFKPTKIFVSHPIDTNPDHRSLFLFLNIALWDLEDRLNKPDIFVYLIHYLGWPKPKGYHLDLKLTPPKELNLDNTVWYELKLTPEEVEKKYKALLFYKTQTKSHLGYLLRFVKANEIFATYSPVKIEKETNVEFSEKADRKNLILFLNKKEKSDEISHLNYMQDGKDLYIRLKLKRRIDKNFGISIFLFGYNKEIDFSKMPKMHLIIGVGGLRIKDKKQTLFIKDVNLVSKGNILVIRVPLSRLQNPDYILSCIKTHFKSLPLSDMGWQILDLK